MALKAGGHPFPPTAAGKPADLLLPQYSEHQELCKLFPQMCLSKFPPGEHGQAWEQAARAGGCPYPWKCPKTPGGVAPGDSSRVTGEWVVVLG